METRACCCAERAAVRVIMPPSPTRPNDTDLLLCTRHFRLSWRALAAQHATVSKLSDEPVPALSRN